MFRRSSEGFLICVRLGRALEVGRLRLVDSVSGGCSRRRESTSLDMTSRSSRQAVLSWILDERFRACVSNVLSGWLLSELSTLLSVAWVAVDDWSNAFDISSACMLRSKSESRYGSAGLVRERFGLDGERGVRLRGDVASWDG